MEEYEHDGDEVTENDEHIPYIPAGDRVMEAMEEMARWRRQFLQTSSPSIPSCTSPSYSPSRRRSTLRLSNRYKHESHEP